MKRPRRAQKTNNMVSWFEDLEALPQWMTAAADHAARLEKTCTLDSLLWFLTYADLKRNTLLEEKTKSIVQVLQVSWWAWVTAQWHQISCHPEDPGFAFRRRLRMALLLASLIFHRFHSFGLHSMDSPRLFFSTTNIFHIRSSKFWHWGIYKWFIVYSLYILICTNVISFICIYGFECTCKSSFENLF